MAAGGRPPYNRDVRRYRRQPRPSPGARGPSGAEFAAYVERLISTRETKEFFRTSEFSLWFVAVIGALFAAAISANFDAADAWSAIALLTAGYILSRGLAKAGTARGWERFDDVMAEARADADSARTEALAAETVGTPLPETFHASEQSLPVGEPPPRSSTGSPLPSAAGEPMERFVAGVATPETKELFRTSEFLLWLLAVLGVLIASAITEGFGATAAWTLLTVLSCAYMLSRGIAKANVPQGAGGGGFPDEGLTGRDQGTYAEIATPETKEFFRTSEFWAMLLTAAGILIASGIDFPFQAPEAWRLLTALGATYMISRGISKIGTGRDASYTQP